jgi:hypothetical protein
MVVYKRTSSQWLKWTLFIIVFALGMTVTFSDVEGIDVSQGKQATVQTDQQNPVETADPTPAPIEDPEAPTSIPEPATIILVGLGLGTAYVLRRKHLRA